ncbi:dolichol-phosphate mannosyltransferase subunit 3 [Schizopora paradoxa]|uniref:Dolichol-phosphate mannosyltransferase subunit 3 n=1 Tax=Schizopora paradoxa TaxID=27342 RepID=A0A0H2SF23_9AGAM|nr:dolichol-phosphate mannosyltransferase subunit 3 [Schizopora paradoxa]
MTRATQFATYGAVAAIAYILLWLDIIPVPFLDATVKDELIPVLPWWLVVAFGAYSLSSLGYGLYTFNDVPAAYEELMSEISQAKSDLQTKGVSVD